MLRVGKVVYLNTLPMFYSFRGFELVEGHPSELVKKLRAGEIEAGIVSSAEYFFNPESYYVLPDLSISSKGKVCSVLLLSKKPIGEVERVRITPNSLTSRYLLSFIFKKVHRIEPAEVPEGEDALMVIGDEALNMRNSYDFVYDLGEAWFEATGLPFVFALFLVRKEAPVEETTALYREIKGSLGKFFSDLKRDRVALPGDREFLRRYFSSCIDYGLAREHLESLKRFFSFLEEETGKPSPDAISLFPL